MDREALSQNQRASKLSSVIQGGLSQIEPINAREIKNSEKPSPPRHITALKPYRTKLKA